MPDQANLADQPKAAIDSLTLKGVAALAVAFIAARAGVELPDGAPAALADALVDLVFALGLIGASVGRARARGPIA